LLRLAGPRGVSVVDHHGLTVIDLAHDGVPAGVGRVSCALLLPPGRYFLRRPLGPSRAGTVPHLEQSLVLPPGWELAVQVPPPAEGIVPAPPGLMLRRPGTPTRHAETGLAATLGLALAECRPVPRALLDQALAAMPGNPLLGILAGHLLLAQGTTTEGDVALDGLVRQLQALLGETHPDVQALGLHCAEPALQPQGSLTALPMLHRSWRLLVAASHDRPRLLPCRLWARTVAKRLQAPYLAWSTDHQQRARAQRELAAATWAGTRPPGAGSNSATGAGRPLPAKCDPATARQRARLLDVPRSALVPLAELYLDTAEA
jgi:hypothetical protein